MKKIVLSVLLLSFASLAFADRDREYRDHEYREDVARVVDVRPNLVTVQQQVCQQGSVVHNDQGADTAIGAGLGAVTGAVIGGRHNKLLGAVIGSTAGAVIGNEVGKDSTTVTPTQVCSLQPVTVQQGQVVTFEYHGQRFTQIFRN